MFFSSSSFSSLSAFCLGECDGKLVCAVNVCVLSFRNAIVFVLFRFLFCVWLLLVLCVCYFVVFFHFALPI